MFNPPVISPLCLCEIQISCFDTVCLIKRHHNSTDYSAVTVLRTGIMQKSKWYLSYMLSSTSEHRNSFR